MQETQQPSLPQNKHQHSADSCTTQVPLLFEFVDTKHFWKLLKTLAPDSALSVQQVSKVEHSDHDTFAYDWNSLILQLLAMSMKGKTLARQPANHVGCDI